MNVNSLARIPNPFRQTIVKDAWESLQDVPEIHAQAFETCCRAFENVKVSRHCDSVLLHGEAGSGKTHLMSRLQVRWTSPRGRFRTTPMCLSLLPPADQSSEALAASAQDFRRGLVASFPRRDHTASAPGGLPFC
jgi:hypothetical protein